MPNESKKPLVVCVDDDASVATLVARAVSTLGVTTRTAPDGEAGFEVWRGERHAVRLVLTDHQMPKCTGLRFVERLRADGYDGAVIVHSSSLTEKDRETYLKLRVDAIIEKPTSFHDLIGAVRSVLARY